MISIPNVLRLVFHHDSQWESHLLHKELIFCSLYIPQTIKKTNFMQIFINCKWSWVNNHRSRFNMQIRLKYLWQSYPENVAYHTAPFYLVHTIIFHIHSIWTLKNIQSQISHVIMQILPKTPLRNTNKKYRW